jgi:hypothetical protein
MRVTLAEPTLARQAGRFVWLELNFDNPANRAFLVGHRVAFTPAFYVLDPADERAAASHFGGMTLHELNQFLDRGAGGVGGAASSPADRALARGDERLGRGDLAQAADDYRHALSVAPPGWAGRGQTLAQLTSTLMILRQCRACAETAAVEAPRLPREHPFVRVALAGLGAALQGDTAAWARTAQAILEPLVVEAVGLDEATRDDRFQAYQGLMDAAEMRGDRAAVARWGERWLGELETAVPRNDDERTALDVARVDVISAYPVPERVIPALTASERAMPGSYNASLRLAQALIEARRYDDALAACGRGLARVDRPLGRTWLHETEAQAWLAKGRPDMARQVLDEATQSAQAIVTSRNRESNLRRIAGMRAEADRATP